MTVSHPGKNYWTTTVKGVRPRSEVRGLVEADICVVGGGYVGLWTALELKKADSSLNVALVESDVCGSGASGRNGGWATSYWRRLPDLFRLYGYRDGLWLAHASADALTDIGEFVKERAIDCDWRQRGGLYATTQDRSSWHAAVEAAAAVGHPEKFLEVTGDEARSLVGSPILTGGSIHTDTAAVNPMKLVAGLRNAVLDAGIQVYERSPMTQLIRGRPATVVTPHGQIRANQVALTLGAWSYSIPELRRSFVNVGSQIVATEPLGDKVSSLPWSNGLVFGDDQLSNHYIQATTDQRIVFGRGLGTIGYGSKVLNQHSFDRRAIKQIAADFARFFPALRSAELEYGWGGAVDRTPHAFPNVGTLRDGDNVRFAVGLSGQGVAQSRLIGRILTSVLLSRDDGYSRCGFVGEPLQFFPPEPLRYIGGNAVKEFLAFCEDREAKGRRTPVDKGILKALVGTHMPRLIEPRHHAKTVTIEGNKP